MADNNNDQLINDILNQLDNAKKALEAESETKDETADEAAEAKAEEAQELPVPHADEQEEPVNEEPAEDIQPPVRQKPAEEKPRRAAGHDRQEQQSPAAEADPHTEDMPEKRNAPPRKKKKKKKKRSRLPGVLILTTFIFAVSVCLSMVIIAFGKDMFGIGKSDFTKLIIVPENATTEEISQLLYDEGIINSPKCFQLFSRLRKSADIYLPGEHFVSPSMAYETIINKLTNVEQEKKEPVNVTFIEGNTIFDAAQLLEEEGVCNADDFLFNFNAAGLGYGFEEYLSQNPDPLKFADARMEGYLFPDTYTFTKDMDPENVCQKIYFNFDQKMNEERLERMKKLGLTLDQLITLSSIVQREAPNREDMDHVAGVFWNRLENPEAETVGMLQSDPTTNYSERVIKPHMDLINKDILNAYDTYKSKGLPPGAICNPGLDAIDAVLTKMETEDYYFVANIYTRETIFSKTYDEHQQNEARVKADEEAYLAEQERLAQEAAYE